MDEDKALLIASAVKLAILGQEVEAARTNLKELVEIGVPYTACEMETALYKFMELDARWKELERQHTQLRKDIKTAKE